MHLARRFVATSTGKGNATLSDRAKKAKLAAAKFFLRIGQVQASQPWRDEWTDYIFPLPLILEAEGTLAEDAKHLAREAKPR